MRITIVSDLTLVNANYRAYQPMRELLSRGHDVRCNQPGEPRVSIARALRSDVLYVYRFVDDEVLSLARHCREAGIAVVWDNDDDLAVVPRSHPRHRRLGGINAQHTLVRTRRMLQLADIVTTPSQFLVERFRALGARDVRLVENFLARELIGIKPRKHDDVVIGWIAGLEHQLDYQSLRLREAFERLLDRHAGLRIHSVGLGLGLRTARYTHVPGAPFLELAEIAAGYDVGIAPLSGVPFNRARSNVKVKEYAAAGTPWLASPVGGYVGLGEAQGGRLVADDRWFDELDKILDDRRGRRALAKRAAAWGRVQGIERNVGVWESVFREAADRAARARATV
jgi:glycosyltransferase involved in cell wall biosynthesis